MNDFIVTVYTTVWEQSRLKTTLYMSWSNLGSKLIFNQSCFEDGGHRVFFPEDQPKT